MELAFTILIIVIIVLSIWRKSLLYPILLAIISLIAWSQGVISNTEIAIYLIITLFVSIGLLFELKGVE